MDRNSSSNWSRDSKIAAAGLLLLVMLSSMSFLVKLGEQNEKNNTVKQQIVNLQDKIDILSKSANQVNLKVHGIDTELSHVLSQMTYLHSHNTNKASE